MAEDIEDFIQKFTMQKLISTIENENNLSTILYFTNESTEAHAGALELASVLVPTKIPSFLAVDNVGKRLCKLCKLYRLPKSRRLPTMYRYWINKESFIKKRIVNESHIFLLKTSRKMSR